MNQSPKIAPPKILAVIVTYEPQFQLLNNLIGALENSSAEIKTLIIDNGSLNSSELDNEVNENSSVKILKLLENVGLAAAQNIGFSEGLSHKFDYILLLDQDSQIDEFFVNNLLESFLFLTEKETKLAAVGCRVMDQNTGYIYPVIQIGRFTVKRVFNGGDYIPASCLISSGTLISMLAVMSVGGMNENFFIDHVDTDWFFRAKAAGFKAYVANNVLMHHTVGNGTNTVFGLNLPRHSCLRRYLSTRNLFFIITRQSGVLPWKLKELITTIPKLLLSLSKSDNRFMHLYAYAMGVVDGCLGRFNKKVNFL